MKPLITRYYEGRMTDLIILALLVLALIGCTNDKTALLGRWERTGCEKKSDRYFEMTASGWPEIEFLEGNIVIVKNNGSWTYSFPQAGFLNIGGNMGVTYQYEIERDLLTLREGEDYCVFQRVDSANSSSGGSDALLGVLLILLAAGVAIVYLVMRHGRQRKTVPAGAASRAMPGPQAFCMHCGQPVHPGGRFCMYCGKPLA